ncbi:MAG: PIN domain-containing protein [Desulfovermiculus sp.]|nr:PIN domain-containing protein [Desulfovermiculus sp.]
MHESWTYVFTQAEIAQLLNYLCSQANHHQVYFLWRPILKDPKDDMILELAVKSSSEYIVTYNTKDFAGAEQFDIKVATAAQFMSLEGFI